MKTTLDHLPVDKQEKVSMVAEIIRDNAPAEMIILFGSYARGDWVEERPSGMEEGPYFKYQSDVDLLVLTEKSHDANNSRLWNRIRDITSNRVDLPVTAIAHTVDFVNKRLVEGQYFFADIKSEGIMLFDSRRFELSELGNLENEERRRIAQKNFDQWFESAVDFFDGYRFYLQKDKFALASFNLH